VSLTFYTTAFIAAVTMLGVLLCHMQGPVYTAMYDYDAQDDDEVSFLENDHIILYEMIDDGWMYGIVQRTGHKGMIPANYVELIQ